MTKSEVRLLAANLRDRLRISLIVDDQGQDLAAVASRAPEYPEPLAALWQSDAYEAQAYGDIRSFFADLEPDDQGAKNLDAEVADALTSARSVLALERPEVGMLPAEVVERLERILDAKSDGPTGFIYTGYEASDPHADSFIAMPSGILLNPIAYKEASLEAILESLRSKGRLVAVADPLMIGDTWVHPQADRTSCGALALACMEEYLHDNGRQLQAYTVIVSRGEGQIAFMVPSPFALRYSQSSEYNDRIVSFVKTRLADEAARHSVLRCDGSPIGVEAIQDFCDSWLEAYEEARADRDTMWLVDPDLGDVNLSLAEVLDRYKSGSHAIGGGFDRN